MATNGSDWPDLFDPDELTDRLAQTWMRKLVYTGGNHSTGISIPAPLLEERGYKPSDEVVTYISTANPDVFCVLLPPRP